MSALASEFMAGSTGHFVHTKGERRETSKPDGAESRLIVPLGYVQTQTEAHGLIRIKQEGLRGARKETQ